VTDLPISFTEPLVRQLRAGAMSQSRRPRGLFDKLKPGDRLWVREPFHLPPAFDDQSPTQYLLSGARAVTFAADGVTIADGARRFARVLPKLLHRMHLVVREVRREQLQDLSDADARAEGSADRAAFAADWDAIHAGGKYTISGVLARWADNPRVTVIAFDVMDRPL
jgi:hypothetical protein